MNLLERQLNTILIDATGEYTGSPELDGRHTMDVVRKSLEFSMKYLKKGGNLVYRVADCN
jgi:23S rRNA U2552 (ribose-2'-O)-methylase RlmE/FtsJ